jgi:hypothetical protein
MCDDAKHTYVHIFICGLVKVTLESGIDDYK